MAGPCGSIDSRCRIKKVRIEPSLSSTLPSILFQSTITDFRSSESYLRPKVSSFPRFAIALFKVSARSRISSSSYGMSRLGSRQPLPVSSKVMSQHANGFYQTNRSNGSRFRSVRELKCDCTSPLVMLIRTGGDWKAAKDGLGGVSIALRGARHCLSRWSTSLTEPWTVCHPPNFWVQ
jgi:hypothetical protein